MHFISLKPSGLSQPTCYAVNNPSAFSSTEFAASVRQLLLQLSRAFSIIVYQ